MSCRSVKCWRPLKTKDFCATCQMRRDTDDLDFFLNNIPTMDLESIPHTFYRLHHILTNAKMEVLLLSVYKRDKALCKRLVDFLNPSLLYIFANHTGTLCPIYNLVINTETVFPKRCIRCIQQCIQHRGWSNIVREFFSNSKKYDRLLKDALLSPRGLERCRSLIDTLRESGLCRIENILERYPELQGKEQFTDEFKLRIEWRMAILKDEILAFTLDPSRLEWFLSEDEKRNILSSGFILKN